MLKVFKYPLNINDIIMIELPKGAQILTVQIQQGNPCLWALVNPSETVTEKRVLRMAGTGHPITVGDETSYLKYISTIQVHNGSLIFHFFEVQ